MTTPVVSEKMQEVIDAAIDAAYLDGTEWETPDSFAQKKETSSNAEAANLILCREIATLESNQKNLVRVFMAEMGKHHAQSGEWKALTNVLTALGGSVTICNDKPHV